MEVEVPYKSLKQTLQALKVQVIDSLPYIHNYIPDYIDSPKSLFYYLKSQTKYKKDPPGIEHLQMAHTLMDRGGVGDCDCFTILALTSLYYLGFTPLYVTIVGKTKFSPTHIYAEVYDPDKKQVCAFDLTNPTYCKERPYNYKQRLTFNI